ncbi:MAG: prepilin-type N-terminal cleavage/methylation domain-containing protein [Verrucomicrobia bacterium]|nr:prepilin-type N-terminal cleavage/methylation domain-containing protein [Verrucomicrobiota bacterium]
MRVFNKVESGFTLVEILIVVAVIGLLISIAVPNFAKTRKVAQANICVENLMQIESAKQMWALETLKADGDPVEPDNLIGMTLYIKKTPECPSGGEYDYNVVGTNAFCSFGNQVTPPHVLE